MLLMRILAELRWKLGTKMEAVLAVERITSHDTTKPKYHDTTQPQYHDTTQPRYHDTTQPRYHDTTQPRYHADELEKLLGLADTGLDNKQTTFTASEIIDCSTEILESDLDMSINSTEVFHKSAMPVEEENDDAGCDVNKESEEQDVNKVRENGTENQEEATIGAPDILLEPEPKEQKLAEQPEGERIKSGGRRKLAAAWQEEEHMAQTSKEEP